MLLSGVRSSCDMLARNSDLYRDVSASSVAFSSSARRASSISSFLRSTSAFCSASRRALLASSSLVCCSSFCCACSSPASSCDCSQQRLGAHGGFDRVEHHADAAGQLLEERQVRVGELVQRRELDHRLDLSFVQHRQRDDIARPRAESSPLRTWMTSSGMSLQQHALAVRRALADQPFVHRVAARRIRRARIRVGDQLLEATLLRCPAPRYR